MSLCLLSVAGGAKLTTCILRCRYKRTAVLKHNNEEVLEGENDQTTVPSLRLAVTKKKGTEKQPAHNGNQDACNMPKICDGLRDGLSGHVERPAEEPPPRRGAGAETRKSPIGWRRGLRGSYFLLLESRLGKSPRKKAESATVWHDSNFHRSFLIVIPGCELQIAVACSCRQALPVRQQRVLF